MSYKSTGIILAEKPSIGIEPTRLYDASRWKNHGTHTDITMVQLPSGLWVRNFNGSTSGINCGADNSFDLTEAVTLAIWIKPLVAIGSYRVFIGKRTSDGSGYYQLSFDNTAKGWMVLHIGAEQGAKTNNTLSLDAWVHLVGTYDRVTIKIYLNGVLQNDQNTQNAAMVSIPSEPVYLGRSGAAGTFYRGLLALSPILNYALSAGQILKIFNNERHWFGV